MPGLWKHGPVTPLRDAFRPQGPMCKAGMFLLHLGDLSKLTTGRVTSMAQYVALLLGSGAQTLWFEPRVHHAKDGKAVVLEKCTPRSPGSPTDARGAKEWTFLNSAPRALHSHTPPPGRGADKRRIQIRHNDGSEHLPTLHL